MGHIISVSYTFPNRATFPHRVSGGTHQQKAPGQDGARDALTALDSCTLKSHHSPAERATVNASLAEIINVTQPPIFSVLFAKANFRAAYARLNEKISIPAAGPAERMEVMG